jgi:DNA replication protein DnaC
MRSIGSNSWSRKNSKTKTGNLAKRLTAIDAIILDELGYLPFPASSGALLFHLISHLYEKTSLIITTNPELCRMGSGFWRRQDGRCLAGSPQPLLRYPGNRQ